VTLAITNETDVETALSGYVVEADRYKLSQVIRNFISNAIKFTPEGGTISVIVQIKQKSMLRLSLTGRLLLGSIKPSKTALRIEVRDTGHGIAKVRCCIK